MNRIIKQLIITIVLSTIVVASVSQSTYAQFTLAPSTKTPVFRFELNEKRSAQAYIVVKNLGDKTTNYLIQSVDGARTQDGNAVSKNPDLEQTAVGTWIKFAKNEITLEPKSEKELILSINVPNNIPPGTYYGGVNLQKAPNKDTESTQTSSGAIIKTSFSYPIWIIINGTQIVDYEISNFAVNDKSFSFTLKNTGNTVISFKPKITIRDATGFYKNEIAANESTLYGAENVSVTIPLDQKPIIGQFTATLAVEAIQKDLISDTSKKLESFSEKIAFTIIPWMLIIIIASILILGISAMIILSKKSSAYLRNCTSYDIQPGESITSIATKLGINWKIIVKLNNLKPPYSIEGMKTLSIPPKIKK